MTEQETHVLTVAKDNIIVVIDQVSTLSSDSKQYDGILKSLADAKKAMEKLL